MLSPRRISALFSVVLALAATSAVLAQNSPATEASEGVETSIPGVVLTRPDGRFLGVETEGMSMKVTFYDAEKKPEAADVIRITARWQDGRPRNTVLLPSGGETLVSPPHLTRPFSYIVYLALVGADEQVKESHSLRLQ